MTAGYPEGVERPPSSAHLRPWSTCGSSQWWWRDTEAVKPGIEFCNSDWQVDFTGYRPPRASLSRIKGHRGMQWHCEHGRWKPIVKKLPAGCVRGLLSCSSWCLLILPSLPESFPSLFLSSSAYPLDLIKHLFPGGPRHPPHQYLISLIRINTIS